MINKTFTVKPRTGGSKVVEPKKTEKPAKTEGKQPKDKEG